jgi:hypothetical protein
MEDEIDQFSAPIVAWLRPHTSLPLGQLLKSAPPFPTYTESKYPLDLLEISQQALLRRYAAAVHPICPIVFSADLVADGPRTHHLKLAMFYTAAVSMPLLRSQKILGITKDSLVNQMKSAVEEAFHDAGAIGYSNLSLFQAIDVYLTPQRLSEVSSSHSIYIAAVIRQFQIAGHDQDSDEDPDYLLQTKRHLWYHLLFLNACAVEAVGPERTMVNDPGLELPEYRDSLDQTPSDGFLDYDSTVSTVSTVRYECYKIHWVIYKDREDLNRGRLRFSSLLEKVKRLTTSVRARYLSHLTDDVPFQKYAALVGKLLLAKYESNILATQYNSWGAPAKTHDLRDR